MNLLSQKLQCFLVSFKLYLSIIQAKTNNKFITASDIVPIRESDELLYTVRSLVTVRNNNKCKPGKTNKFITS